MRLGFVVPRYGLDVVGGAETLCRQYAEHLAERGHHVEIFTTCARNHFTWENVLPEGDSRIHGIQVHRYPISHSKDLNLAARLEQRIAAGERLDTVAQLAWIMNAAASDGLLDALEAADGQLDTLIFLPYLFATTCFGVTVCPERSIVVPCLHDEAYARFDVLQGSLQHARGLIFNSAAERELASRLIGELPDSRIVGVGFDEPSASAQPSEPRRRSTEDYIAYVGRREMGKNWPLLVAWMTIYSKALSTRGPSSLASMGSGHVQLTEVAQDVVRDIGYVNEQTKHEVLASAVATAQLSRNESFSYAIFESWLARTPVVVHAGCPVTRGFCEASGGGLWAETYEEFAVILDELRGGSTLRGRLASSGYDYVMDEFRWPVVVERLERAIEELTA